MRALSLDARVLAKRRYDRQRSFRPGDAPSTSTFADPIPRAIGSSPSTHFTHKFPRRTFLKVRIDNSLITESPQRGSVIRCLFFRLCFVDSRTHRRAPAR